MINKKNIFLKFGDIIQVITGSKKGLVGQIISLNIKRSCATIAPFFNLNIFKNKLKKNSYFENSNTYNEYDFLYSQNTLLFDKINKFKLNRELKLFPTIIIAINKKNKRFHILNMNTNFRFCVLIPFSNIILFEKNIKFLENLKNKI